MSDFLRLVGEHLRTIRLAKNLTQRDVAEKTGMSDSYISDCERGDRNMTLITLEKFMTALDISPNELFNFKNIDLDAGIEEKRLFVEVYKSMLMERSMDEIKYVVKHSKDFLNTVDHIKDK